MPPFRDRNRDMQVCKMSIRYGGAEWAEPKAYSFEEKLAPEAAGRSWFAKDYADLKSGV